MIKPVKVATLDKIYVLKLKHLFYCFIFILMLFYTIHRLGYNYVTYNIERTLIDVKDTSSTKLR